MKNLLLTVIVFYSLSSINIFAAESINELEALSHGHWSEQEKRNVVLTWDFMANLLVKRDYDYVEKNFGSHRYKQHSVTFQDGVKGLIEGVKQMEKNFPEFTYEVKSIHADGEYVIFHSHLVFDEESKGKDEKGMIVIDKWRVVEGEFVEHWDSLQPLERKFSFIYFLLGNPKNHSNGIF